MRNGKGFTLLEVLTVMALIAVLAGLALPAIGPVINRKRADAHAWLMYEALQSARILAVTRGRPTTVCPSDDGLACGGGWAKGYMVFADDNGNRDRDANEALHVFVPAMDAKDSLNWKAFQHKSSLQFLPTGISNHQNGSFVICVQGQPKYARAVILTKMGRPRLSRDSNGDGIHEDASGKALSC